MPFDGTNDHIPYWEPPSSPMRRDLPLSRPMQSYVLIWGVAGLVGWIGFIGFAVIVSRW